MNRWWPQRRARSTAATPARPRVPFSRCPTPTPRADDQTDNQAVDRQWAAVVSSGRIARDIRASGEHPIDDGQVYVCGVGLVPVSVAIAAADLHDARDRDAHPTLKTPTTAPTPRPPAPALT